MGCILYLSPGACRHREWEMTRQGIFERLLSLAAVFFLWIV